MEVDDLHVHFVTSRGLIRAVEGLSYTAQRGEMVAIVGESGCGKSVSALSVMRLIPRTGRIVAGRVMFDGRDLLRLSDQEMRQVRGREIAMIFQDPMTSLNPVLPIGLQIMEPMLAHLGMDRAAAGARAVELLGSVGIPDAPRRLDQYPHQFSGGMRQRAMIAMALACEPKLLIADEPTTALDVTIQTQILSLLKDLTEQRDIAIVIITHNLGVVAKYADRVNVMYAARLVERTTTNRIFACPCHPYTVGLMRSVPRLDRPPAPRLATIEGLPPDLLAAPVGCRFAPRCPARLDRCEAARPPLVEVEPGHWSACVRARELAESGLGELDPADVGREALVADRMSKLQPLLEVEDLTKRFPVRGAATVLFPSREVVTAVDRVSFQVYPGETLALVGESGSGKTTTARTILRLEEPTSGRVRFDGVDLTAADARAMKHIRRRIQIIFQDPYGALDPRMTIGEILAEPLRVFGLEPTRVAVRGRVTELLTQVGLFPYMAARYPHQLSGGQRQRVGIARALAMQPRLIICDEPVSALDVSIQGQVINLLKDLQAELALTYLFIAHDLAVVRHIADRVLVMYLGRVMETASREELYDHPQHPYTQALLEAAPVPDPAVERSRRAPVLAGEIPSPMAPPPGCVFHTRCPRATDECRAQVPALREVRPNHFAACIKL